MLQPAEVSSNSLQRYLKGCSRNFKSAFGVGVSAYFKMAIGRSIVEVVDLRLTADFSILDGDSS